MSLFSYKHKGWLNTMTAVLVCLFTTNIDAAETIGESVHFGHFGTVRLYKQSEQPKHVVLFVSGDGGWNLGVIDMARALSESDALVAGIDITYYLKQLAKDSNKCSYRRRGIRSPEPLFAKTV